MRRAIVIGGSLAGMCAARALGDVFDEVVVLDRDSYPDGAVARAGVPQSRHAHGLLQRGRRELDHLFPGFSAAMLAGGALSFDPGVGFALLRKVGWQAHGHSGPELLWSSRDLLEHTVRTLLKAHGRVQLRERARVIGLCGDGGEQPRVTGVRVREDSGGEAVWPAELVVDASGRGTRASTFLRELGIAPPPEECVDALAGYASRVYQAPTPRPAGCWWRGLWIEWQAPDVPRGGTIFPIEGDRWLVTLAGINGDLPPADERGFVAFMHRLASPSLAEAVAHATPISEIASSRQLANVRRRYERWQRPPRGFIALGDAACAFNPFYGQGMSVAAVAGSLLRAQLARDSVDAPGFERRFFAEQAAFLDSVWLLATRADFLWSKTRGERPKQLPLVSRYVGLAFRTSHFDPRVRPEINSIVHLMAPLHRVFAPPLMARVVSSSARRMVARVRSGTPSIPSHPPMPA